MLLRCLGNQVLDWKDIQGNKMTEYYDLFTKDYIKLCRKFDLNTKRNLRYNHSYAVVSAVATFSLCPFKLENKRHINTLYYAPKGTTTAETSSTTISKTTPTKSVEDRLKEVLEHHKNDKPFTDEEDSEDSPSETRLIGLHKGLWIVGQPRDLDINVANDGLLTLTTTRQVKIGLLRYKEQYYTSLFNTYCWILAHATKSDKILYNIDLVSSKDSIFLTSIQGLYREDSILDLLNRFSSFYTLKENAVLLQNFNWGLCNSCYYYGICSIQVAHSK